MKIIIALLCMIALSVAALLLVFAIAACILAADMLYSEEFLFSIIAGASLSSPIIYTLIIKTK